MSYDRTLEDIKEEAERRRQAAFQTDPKWGAELLQPKEKTMKTTVSIMTDNDSTGTTWSIDVGEQAQKHVLRNFNPSGDQKVDATKVLCAAIIQQMIDLRDAPAAPGHVKRAASIAITQCEALQMQAVKANFVQV